jgi:hypothetical protein
MQGLRKDIMRKDKGIFQMERMVRKAETERDSANARIEELERSLAQAQARSAEASGAKASGAKASSAKASGAKASSAKASSEKAQKSSKKQDKIQILDQWVSAANAGVPQAQLRGRQGCEIMARPEERGGCDCESCTRAKARIAAQGR